MARVQWHGQNFNATPIEQYPNGDWLMESLAHGPRISVGTRIRVTSKEIIEMAAAETPPNPAESAATLETAMADERKTLPSIAELRAQRADQPQDTANGQAPQA